MLAASYRNEKHAGQMRFYTNRRRLRWKLNGLCNRCGQERVEGCTYCIKCKVKIMNSSLRRKIELITLLGGKCVNCDETRVGCLEIDHVNEDGAQHRRELMGSSRVAGQAFYQKLLKVGLEHCNYDLQILCANCHALKQWAE